MHPVYSIQLKQGDDGRIVEKVETVNETSVTWKFSYDNEASLTEAYLDGKLVCQCYYDNQGRRSRDYFPMTQGKDYRNFAYRLDNRLMSAGNNRYTHNKAGFRSIWSREGKYTTYEYAPDSRLLKADKEDEGVTFEFSHDDNGQREVKHRNGQMVEAYVWLDFLRLAGFHDGESGYRFIYNDNERTPHAMQREDGAEASLYYDQVGSLRVVADMSGNVIKEILYDPFGGIIKDTNPALRIPIGFAGGLHDRDLGFVRFGWRDYDTVTGRWTAPDPMGDKGGDSDWYGYCLDDPVNGVDPLGLKDMRTEQGVTYNTDGIPIDEVGLKNPDFMLDPVMDWLPTPPLSKAATKVGKATRKAYKAGKEFKVGKDIRIAPFGNRTNHKYGKFPHYHRKGKVDPQTGLPVKGQGKKRHRPAEPKNGDTSFWDRF